MRHQRKRLNARHPQNIFVPRVLYLDADHPELFRLIFEGQEVIGGKSEIARAYCHMNNIKLYIDNDKEGLAVWKKQGNSHTLKHVADFGPDDDYDLETAYRLCFDCLQREQEGQDYAITEAAISR